MRQSTKKWGFQEKLMNLCDIHTDVGQSHRKDEKRLCGSPQKVDVSTWYAEKTADYV